MQASRESFGDALTSASSASIRRIDATYSEERRTSDERSKESTDNQDQNSNSFSIQSKKSQDTPDKAQQSESISQSSQEVDSKKDQSADSMSSEKGKQGTNVRKSDGLSSKNAAFTVQVASPFNLQASTSRPELNGVFSVASPAIATDDLAPKADSPEQSSDAQITNAVADQGTGLQGQPGVTGPILSAGVKDSRAEQESDAGQVSGALKAGRAGVGQLEPELACTDQASDSKSLANAAAQLSTAGAGGDASETPAFDPTSILQASLAAATQKDSAGEAVDGSLNQAAVKALKSKVSGSAVGLNSDTGATPKNDKGGDASGDRFSLPSANMAGLESSSTQPGSAHVAAADTKGSEAGALQTIVVAAQVESRGATGTPTTTGSSETTVHRGSGSEGGNGSEGLTSEQLNGSELAGMSGINAARLIQTMGASEMRMGMHSSEFGDISIRTSVTQQQMQTQISVDHDELGNALSAHIPDMQMKLGNEYGLHATIEVNQSGTSFSSDGDRSQPHQHETTVRPVEDREGPAALQNDLIGLNAVPVTNGNYRLDIRA